MAKLEDMKFGDMSPYVVKVKLTVRIVPFEPDGSPCYSCGDTIFMEGRKLIFIQNGKKVGESNYRFCQACGDGLESSLNGDGEEKEWWENGDDL